MTTVIVMEDENSGEVCAPTAAAERRAQRENASVYDVPAELVDDVTAAYYAGEIPFEHELNAWLKARGYETHFRTVFGGNRDFCVRRIE
jgi:hypothetical protein